MAPPVTLTRAQLDKVKLGFCVHRDATRATAASDAVLMDMQRQLGSQVARCILDWTQVERTKGVYTWSQYEAWIDGLKKAKIDPWLILQEGNPLYTPAWDQPPLDPVALKAFARFVKAAVAKFGMGTSLYEPLNEANDRTSNGGLKFVPPLVYAQLINEIVAIVQLTWLITAGTSWHDEANWLRTMAAALLDRSKVRAIGQHPYTGGDDHYPRDLMCAPEALKQRLDAASKLCGGMDAWNTEIGVSITECLSNVPGATLAQKLDRQADLYTRYEAAAYIAGKPFSLWYCLQDTGRNYAEREDSFGAFDADGVIKPLGVRAAMLGNLRRTANSVTISREGNVYQMAFDMPSSAVKMQTVFEWTA